MAPPEGANPYLLKPLRLTSPSHFSGSPISSCSSSTKTLSPRFAASPAKLSPPTLPPTTMASNLDKVRLTQPLTQALIIVELKDSPFEAGDWREVRPQDGKGQARRAGGARFTLSSRGGDDAERAMVP